MEFKILKIKDLYEYINSEEYINAANIPISPQRALSYIKNPRTQTDNFAVFMLVENHQILAYRCLFSDTIVNEEIRENFYWISGSWVHPEYRRMGLSMKILNKIFVETHGKLMFSNYAPNSKSLYDKSEKFMKIFLLKGKRLYFKFAFARFLPPKSKFFDKIKVLLQITDYFLNIWVGIYKKLTISKLQKPDFEEINTFTPELELFLNKMNKSNIFKRNISEFSHFIDNPWVEQRKAETETDKKYYFTSWAKRFFYKNVIIRNHEGNICGFFIAKIRNNDLRVPYFYVDKKYEEKAVDIIFYMINKYNICYTTFFNESILKYINKYKNHFLFSKEMIHDFYASKKFNYKFNENSVVYEGDGDNAYT